MIPSATSNHSASLDWQQSRSTDNNNDASSETMFPSFDGSNHHDDDYTFTNPDITSINNDDEVIQLKNPVIPSADFIPLTSLSNHSSSISISADFAKHSHTPSFGLSESFPQPSPLISPRTTSVYGSEGTDNTTGLFNISMTSPATSFSITTPDVSPQTLSEYDLFHSANLVYSMNQSRNSVNIGNNSNIGNAPSNSSPPLTPLSLEQKMAMPSNHSPHSSVSSTTSLLSISSQHEQEDAQQHLLQNQGFVPITNFVPISQQIPIQDLSTEGTIVYLLSPEGTINCVSSNSEALLGRSHESQKNTSLTNYIYQDTQKSAMCNQIIKTAIATGKRYVFDILFKHGTQEAYVPLKSTCFALYNLDLTTSAGDIMSFINNLYNSYLPQDVNPDQCKGIIVIATPNLQASFKYANHMDTLDLDQDPTLTGLTSTSRPQDMDDTMILNGNAGANSNDLEENHTQTQSMNVTSDSSQNLWMRRKVKELGGDPSQYVDMNMGLNIANGSGPVEEGVLSATGSRDFRFSSEEPLSAASSTSSLHSNHLAGFSPMPNMHLSSSVPPSASTNFTFPAYPSVSSSLSSSPSVNVNTNIATYNMPFATGSLDDLSAAPISQQRGATTAELAAAQAVAVASGPGMTRGQTTNTAPNGVAPHGFDFGLDKVNQQSIPSTYFAAQTFPYTQSSTPANQSHSQQSSVSSASSCNSGTTTSNAINSSTSPKDINQLSSSGNSSSSLPNSAPIAPANANTNTNPANPHTTTTFWNPAFSGTGKALTPGSDIQQQVSASTAFQQQQLQQLQLQLMASMGVQHPSQMNQQQQQQLYATLTQFQQQQQQQQHPQNIVQPVNYQFPNQQQIPIIPGPQKQILTPQGIPMAGMNVMGISMNMNMIPGMNTVVPMNMNALAGINAINMNQFYGTGGAAQGMNAGAGTAITTDATGFQTTATSSVPFGALAAGHAGITMTAGSAAGTVAGGMRGVSAKRKGGRYGSVPTTGGSNSAGSSGRSGRGNNHTGHVCTECRVEESPEWRKGPKGPKTLCNACGLRWAKKSRKENQKAAAAAAAAAAASSLGGTVNGTSSETNLAQRDGVNVLKSDNDTKEGIDAMLESSAAAGVGIYGKNRGNSVSSLSSLSSSDSRASEELIIPNPKGRNDSEKRHHSHHGAHNYHNGAGHGAHGGLGGVHHGLGARQAKVGATLSSHKGDFSVSKNKSLGSFSTAAIPASAVVGASGNGMSSTANNNVNNSNGNGNFGVHTSSVNSSMTNLSTMNGGANGNGDQQRVEMNGNGNHIINVNQNGMVPSTMLVSGGLYK